MIDLPIILIKENFYRLMPDTAYDCPWFGEKVATLFQFNEFQNEFVNRAIDLAIFVDPKGNVPTRNVISRPE